MAKLYDLACKVGSYTNRNGEEKARWQNIGAVLETKDGGKVILIDRTFNPAGVPVEPGRDQIMVSMFKPKEQDGQPPSEHQQGKQNGYAPPQSRNAKQFEDLSDDIPF